MGGIFGGGGTQVYTTTTQSAAQAANVTVNPSTTVSLSVDTQDLAKAIDRYTASAEGIASADLAETKDLYTANLLLNASSVKLLSDALQQGQASQEIDAAESQQWRTLAERLLKGMKFAAIGYGVVLLSRR